jgi:hypothetical protein
MRSAPSRVVVRNLNIVRFGGAAVLELSGTTIRIVETTTGSTTMKSTALRCNHNGTCPTISTFIDHRMLL